jgi:hypothetical protein
VRAPPPLPDKAPNSARLHDPNGWVSSTAPRSNPGLQQAGSYSAMQICSDSKSYDRFFILLYAKLRVAQLRLAQGAPRRRAFDAAPMLESCIKLSV